MPVKSCLGRHGEPLSKGVININFGRCVFITCFGFGLLLSDVKIAVWTADVQLCVCVYVRWSVEAGDTVPAGQEGRRSREV